MYPHFSCFLLLLLLLLLLLFEAAFATYLEAAQRFGKSPSSTLNHHPHPASTKHDEGSRSAHHHALVQNDGRKMGGIEMEGGGMSGGGSDEREDDDEHWMTVHANTATENACLHAKIKLGEILASCCTGSMDIEGHCYAELVALLTTLQFIQQY